MKSKTKISNKNFIIENKITILLAIIIFALAMLANARFFGMGLMEYDAVIKLVTHSAKTPLIDVFTMPDHSYISSYNSYRPVPTFSWWIISSFAGMDFVPYQWLNFVLHAACCVLLFLLAKVLFEDKKGYFSFFGALIFAFHPIQLSAVLYVSCAPDLWVALFSLLSIIFFLNYLKKKKYSFFWLSFLFCALGIFSKEIGAAIPILLFIIALIFSNEKKIKTRIIYNVQLIAPFFALIVFYVVMMYLVLGRVLMNFADVQLPLGVLLSDFFRFLFYPIDIFKTNISASYYDLFLNYFANVAGVILFAAIFVVLALYFIRKKKKIELLILLWLVLLVILFSAVKIIHPRYMYSALIPFSLIFAFALKKFAKIPRKIIFGKNHIVQKIGLVIIGLFAIYFISFSGLFYNYSEQWAVQEINTNYLQGVVFSAADLPANEEIILVNYPVYFISAQKNFDYLIQLSNGASVQALFDYYFPDKNFRVSSITAVYPSSPEFELMFVRLEDCVFVAKSFDKSKGYLLVGNSDSLPGENSYFVKIYEEVNSNAENKELLGTKNSSKAQNFIITFPRRNWQNTVIFSFDGKTIKKYYFGNACSTKIN